MPWFKEKNNLMSCFISYLLSFLVTFLRARPFLRVAFCNPTRKKKKKHPTPFSIKRRHCGRLVYVIDLASINATVVSSTVIKGRVRSEWRRAVRTPIQHDFERNI
jgi:hypothetical protein